MSNTASRRGAMSSSRPCKPSCRGRRCARSSSRITPKRATDVHPLILNACRIHFIQHWFNLADLACEEALYDSCSLRRFVGIDLGREPVPDATTLLKFRKLLNENKLGEALFAQVGQLLQGKGVKVSTGTIVDATIQLARPAPPRTRARRVTPRCTRPAKASSGTLA
jgi:hypothetical protein